MRALKWFSTVSILMGGLSVASLCFTANASVIDSNDTNRSRAPITSTVPSATGATDASQMNMQDWNNFFKQNGMGSDSIGNTLGQFSSTDMGSVAFSGDPNQLSSENLKANATVKNIPSVTAFSQQLFAELATQASSNSIFNAATQAKTIKCYITRNIPYGYKCPYTGLSYSGMKYGNIDRTKKQCESECYQQRECLNLELNPQKKIDTYPDQTFSLTINKQTITIPADNTKILENVQFSDVMAQHDEKAYYELIYKNRNGRDIVVATNFLSSGGGGKKTFYINDIVQDVKINIYTKSTATVNVEIKNIELNYKQNDRWFCPSQQDISQMKPGDFSILCPSGETLTIPYTYPGGGTVNFKICADGKGSGDNMDGTYSSQSTCVSACRIQYGCSEDLTAINTESLQNFEEGCIEGQTNCSNTTKDCLKARTTATTKVLNEVVFDATQNSWPTVLSGVQLQNVDRPRILLDDQKTFQERSQEEWKDKAYKAMADAKTYNYTTIGIGEDTNSSSAYGIYLKSGVSYGVANTASRSLVWKLKPKALEVNSGKNYYVYNVVIANVEYRNYDTVSGKTTTVGANGSDLWQNYLNNPTLGELTNQGNPAVLIDEIWWLKTSTADTFKPFLRAIDKYRYTVVENNDTNKTSLTYSVNNSSSYMFETFSGATWTGISSASQAEYMQTETFAQPNMYYEYTIISELGNMLDILPGLARRAQYTLQESGQTVSIQRYYTGNRDGTGDYIPKFRTYGIYSQEQLTYGDIANLINNGNVKAYFEMGAELNFPKVVKDDASVQNGIQIFLYGPEANNSAFMNIKPKQTDIGKKGFIFVFLQDGE